MGIRRYKPNNAGRRNMSVSDFAELTKGATPEKSLLRAKRRCNGRNNQGIITVRHRGGGCKRKYRLIDYRRNKDGIPATVNSIQYDLSGPGAPPTVGNCLPVSEIPLGTEIHNIELLPGRGGVMCRTAGVKAVLVACESGWAQITLPSGEIRRISSKCRAVVGVVGNSDHMNIVIGKAGRVRWMGRRPTVRGTAMNPIDHPHGGGEGRTKGGRHPVSPSGKPTKGTSTRNKKKPSNSAIIRRRRSRRYGILKLG